MKIFYILNGSNDLYDSVLNNLNTFLDFMKERKDLEGYCIYKIEDCDYLNIWSKGRKENLKRGVYEIKNGIILEKVCDKFFLVETLEEKEVQYIDIEGFLNTYMKDLEKNVLVISGHGGPFQCLLDMKEKKAFSMNTYNLANILNKRKIEYLILDMCSMNYIEVLYEILYKENIENLITYRSFAPLEGIEFNEIMKAIQSRSFRENFKRLDSLLINLDKESVSKLDFFRVNQNRKILELLNKRDKEFKRGINVLRTEGARVGLQTKGSEGMNGETVAYIKYFLRSEDERKIYSKFKYTKDNLWNMVVRGEFKIYDENINLIRLEKEGLENIIMQYVKEEEAYRLTEEYIRIKEVMDNVK